MTEKQLRKAFERETDAEFLDFERIKNPLHPRRDLCAFLMLHVAVPGTDVIVSDAAHDEIFLSIDLDKLARVASADLIRDLVRCGVRYSSDHDCLAMFT